MNLVKFDPMRPAFRRSLLDDFFNNSFTNVVGSDFVRNMPSVNVTESEDGFNIELAAPGLNKDDFKITIEKHRLLISSEKESNEEVTENKYRRREFNYSSFTRSFHLPKTIDRDKISAEYENGVLVLELPKKAEILKEEQGRTIEIK